MSPTLISIYCKLFLSLLFSFSDISISPFLFSLQRNNRPEVICISPRVCIIKVNSSPIHARRTLTAGADGVHLVAAVNCVAKENQCSRRKNIKCNFIPWC